MKLCIVNLQGYEDYLPSKISGGMKKRAGLARAMALNPKILFFDEPSTGLDPQSRLNVWKIIRDIKSRGKAIVLTTHYMEEAQSLCDTIVIIDNGKLIETGSPESLISEHCRDYKPALQNLESVFLKLTGKHLRD